MRAAQTSVMLAAMEPLPNAKTLRLLIVDDSRHFLDAACSALEQGGITVVGTASTTAEALEGARDLSPDGILVDIDLGDESGLSLARELAAHGAAPVVLISAYPKSDLADLIEASPAIGFLSKTELSASAVWSLLATEGESG
jgi:DNA-binding NarL/FixJ family response regulator